MPHEHGYQDGDKDDYNNANRRSSAPAATTVVHYNRTVSHTGSCSFLLQWPLIPTLGKRIHTGGVNR